MFSNRPDGYSGTIASEYTADEWSTAEAAGLVCLPAAGLRTDKKFNTSSSGYYWSSTPNGDENAYRLYFTSSSVSPASNSNRYRGQSVRLVRE